jgi:hypothetical protein
MEREQIVFKSDPQRDAYRVIAGFIFQINTTIERWLELKDGEVVELERGEDIDVIQVAVRGGGQNVFWSRLKANDRQVNAKEQ